MAQPCTHAHKASRPATPALAQRSWPTSNDLARHLGVHTSTVPPAIAPPR